MAVNSPLSTTNGEINITSGTGTISIAADMVPKTLNLGNQAGATLVNINAGTSGVAIEAANGVISLASGTGAINIGTDSGEKTITIGNTQDQTAVNVRAGSQNISLSSQWASILMQEAGITLNSSNSEGSINLISGSGDIDIGTDATAKLIEMGNQASGTEVNIYCGTGGMALASGNGDISINSGTGSIDINSSTGALNIGTEEGQKIVTIGSTTGASGIVMQIGTGGFQIPAISQTGAATFTSSGYISNAVTDDSEVGYVLTSNGSATPPSFAPSSSETWSTVSGSSVVLSPASGYIVSAETGSPISMTLPVSSLVGQKIYIQGNNTSGFEIRQNAGQSVSIGTSTSTVGASGTVTSSSGKDSIVLVCIVENTSWASLGAPLSSGFVFV